MKNFTNLSFSGLTNASLAVNATGGVYAAATTTFSSGLLYANGNVTNSGVTSNVAGNGLSAGHARIATGGMGAPSAFTCPWHGADSICQT